MEKGNAPSATEIVRMSKAGIQDEYMYPNYYADITNEDDVSLLFQLIGSTHEENVSDNFDDASENNIHVTEDWAKIVEQESVISERNLQDFQETASFRGSSPSPVLTTPVSSSSSSTSNAAESSTVTTEPTVVKNALKPPPGFENTPHRYYFSSTTINLSNVDNLPIITSQTSSNPNMLMFPNNYTSNTLPQAKIPNLTTQTASITQPVHAIPSPQTLNPALSYLQLQLLMNNYQSSQPYLGNFNQSVLINQQNPLFLQQNPIQQSYLYNQSNPWNNLQLNQNTPVNVNQQPTNLNMSRQLLQNFVLGCLMKGELELLTHLEEKFKGFPEVSLQDQQRSLLFKVVCEMIKNPSLIADQEYFTRIITNLLNLLSDVQIIELASRQVSELNDSNIVCNTTGPTKETLEALARLTVSSVEKTENPQSCGDTDKEVQSIVDEASKSLVIKTG